MTNDEILTLVEGLATIRETANLGRLRVRLGDVEVEMEPADDPLASFDTDPAPMGLELPACEHNGGSTLGYCNLCGTAMPRKASDADN